MNAVERAIRDANPIPDVTAPPNDAIDLAAVLARVESSRHLRVRQGRRSIRLPQGWLLSAAAAVVVLGVIGGVSLLSGRVEPATSSAPTAASLAPDVTLFPPRVVQRPSLIDDPHATMSAAPVIPADARERPRPGAAVATAGTPLPDIANAEVADEGGPPAPLGTIDAPPNADRLDFFFEVCDAADACARDARFADPDDPTRGSGSWPAGRPFHIRHGFPTEAAQPLGAGFDLAVYVFSLTEPGEFGGLAGPTVRYTADYVMREQSTSCGPNYREQDVAVTCEVFVHDFPEGLPAGRWAIWAVWEAPCWAWVDFGLIGSCADPNEVISLFSAGVDSPFDPRGFPHYSTLDERPRTAGS